MTLVRHRLTSPDGAAIAGKKVIAQLMARDDLADGSYAIHVPDGASFTGEVLYRRVVAFSDSDGWLTWDLTPNEYIVPGGTYYQILGLGRSRTILWVPDDDAPVELSECRLNLVDFTDSNLTIVQGPRGRPGTEGGTGNLTDSAVSGFVIKTGSSTRTAIQAMIPSVTGKVDTATYLAGIAAAKDRANHVGTQPVTTIAGLATVASTGSYLDLTNRPTNTGNGSGSGTSTGWVSVKDYGAVGDGIADDTAGVAAAFAAVADGGVVIFPAGGNYRISTVALPNKTLNVLAEGAMISTLTPGTYAFTQINRKRVTWEGGRFVGLGSGFALNLAASATQSYDVAFSGVSFVLPAAQTAINLNGGREGTISECYFELCTGIRLFETANTHITGSQFKNCTKGIFADGSTGTAFNAGVMINSVTMMGCGYGVHAVGHDWLTIVNSRLDSCDRPVVLVNQDIASLSHSYFSNREMNSGTSVVPTIQLTSQAGAGGSNTRHIKISNCSIVNNVGSLPDQSVGIAITGGADWVNISNNSIHSWRKYGIQISGVNTYVKVLGNDVVSPAPASGAAGLYGAGGNDSTWVVKNNYFSSPMANFVNPQVDGSGTTAGVEGVAVYTTSWPNRPIGYARVRWVGGTVQPPAMAVGDVWEHDA